MLYFKKRNGNRVSLLYCYLYVMSVYFATQHEWWLHLGCFTVALADNFLCIYTKAKEDKK